MTDTERWARSNPDLGRQHGPQVDYDQIDPGIRKTVQLIRGWGFDTCDSGDGQSKAALGWEDGSYLSYPHVFIAVNSSFMAAEADRLKTLLEGAGNVLGTEEGQAYVEVTYDPHTRAAVLSVVGLADDDWSKK